MLLDVLVVVVVAVAATGGLAGLCERAGNECLDAGVAAALGACIDRDAGLGKRLMAPPPIPPQMSVSTPPLASRPANAP